MSVEFAVADFFDEFIKGGGEFGKGVGFSKSNISRQGIRLRGFFECLRELENGAREAMAVDNEVCSCEQKIADRGKPIPNGKILRLLNQNHFGHELIMNDHAFGA